MTVSSVEIPLADHFDDAVGLLTNYDAYDGPQRAQLANQRHIDVRSFRPGETWSTGTVGPQADRHDWYGISLALGVGVTTSESFAPLIDLSEMDPADDLSLALSAFPNTSLNLAQCFVDFTSNTNNNFTAGPTVSVPMTGLGAANQELKVPLSTLSPLGYRVKGVRFRLTATVAATFRCLAIRVLGADWEFAPLDIDTRTQRIVRPVSRNGGADFLIQFPANTFSDPMVPTDWPILFRATTPSTTEDPRPIDLSQAVVFYTGQGAGGDIRLLFREYAWDILTQLDLDLFNSGTGITQQQLEEMGRQPDYDRALYLSKDQADLDNLPQSVLDGMLQYNLEAEPDFFTAAWVEVRIEWDDPDSTVTVRDTEGNDYTFDAGLEPESSYVALVELRDNSMRVRIHPISTTDAVDYDVTTLDTTLVIDDFMFARRAGRVGWYASLTDGDAYVDSIRSYDANFAEYRSVPLRSITPVVGGQVFYGGSPPREHFTGVEGINDASVTPDDSKSSSGRAYRVDAAPGTLDGGVQTNQTYLDNFSDAVVAFDLWFPAGAYEADMRLEAYLLDAFDHEYELNLARLVPDRWQSYRLDLDVFHGTLLPGLYSFNLALVSGSTTFYLDNFSLRQPVLSWSGRAEVADPWNDDNMPWMDFKDTLNSHTAGALFTEPGFRAQVRAIARRQNAELTTVKFLPKFADIGRLVWDDEQPAKVTPIILIYDATALGANLMTFGNVSVTLGSGRFAVYYEWSFGDGQFATGPTARHTYPAPGTYRSALTIVDNQGSRATRFQNVTVT